MIDTIEGRLRRHVSVLSRDIGERHVWRPDALGAAAAYIESELAQAGYDVRRQPFDARGVTCANLQVEQRGSDRGAGIFVLGAHYDTVAGSPGADDNASGVAALIEIARILRRREARGDIRCVAFANEEAPFFATGAMGSLVYARAARERADDIRLMVSLEMLGYYSSARGSQRYPPFLRFFYPDRGDFIGFVSDLSSRSSLAEFHETFRSRSAFPSQRLASPRIVRGVSLSDQHSFWRVGYRAIMATDTAFYRNPHYHGATDTPDKLDYRSMAQVALGIADSISALADRAQPRIGARPRFNRRRSRPRAASGRVRT